MKILIVDDDAGILRMMARFLGSCGHDVEVCEGPFGTSVRALRTRPDLILLDVMMPGLNGPAVAEVLDRIALEPRPRVVLWSSCDEPALAQLSRECGLPVLSKRRPMNEIVGQLERMAPPSP